MVSENQKSFLESKKKDNAEKIILTRLDNMQIYHIYFECERIDYGKWQDQKNLVIQVITKNNSNSFVKNQNEFVKCVKFDSRKGQDQNFPSIQVITTNILSVARKNIMDFKQISNAIFKALANYNMKLKKEIVQSLRGRELFLSSLSRRRLECT